MALHQRLNIKLVREQFCLDGCINESADFLPLLNYHKPKLRLNLAQVVRINSVGTRAWIQMIKKLQGKKIEYHECSVAMINSANMFVGFLPRQQVISFYVPFICNACELEFTTLFQVKDLGSLHVAQTLVDLQQCAACARPAALNDETRVYFNFLFPE